MEPSIRAMAPLNQMNLSDDLKKQCLADLRSDQELIRLALTKDPEREGDEYWHPIRVLEHRLPLMQDAIKQLAQDSNAPSRELAAAILGQHAVKEKWMGSQCVDLLLGMLHEEKQASVLTSILSALGHFNDARVIPHVLAFKTHPDANVRYALTESLARQEDDRAIGALIELSRDADREVRNWSTFNLASMITTDTPETRQALHERLSEEDDEIRGEAMVGLVIRRDYEVIPSLLEELECHEPDELQESIIVGEVADLIIDYALAGDTRWSAVIQRLEQLGIGDIERLRKAFEMMGQSGDARLN